MTADEHRRSPCAHRRKEEARQLLLSNPCIQGVIVMDNRNPFQVDVWKIEFP